jgi:hypothetical protein
MQRDVDRIRFVSEAHHIVQADTKASKYNMFKSGSVRLLQTLLS